jgi:hypothetical protein
MPIINASKVQPDQTGMDTVLSLIKKVTHDLSATQVDVNKLIIGTLPVGATEYDGGDAFTTTWEETIDAGDATTV